MYINPSLAKGLTNRLLTELPERIRRKVAAFSETAHRVRKNKLAFEKLSQSASEIFQNDALFVYLGGSNSNPYLGVSLICAVKEREYQDWEEGAILGISLVLMVAPFAIFTSEPRFRISQHAVARLYQRTRNDLANYQPIDLDLVLPELRQVPLWTSYWLYALYALKNAYGITKLTPVIPTENGLLFAECNFGNLTLEIRTFVGDSLLSSDQLEVKNILLAAGSFLEASPLSLGLVLIQHALDGLAIDEEYLSRMIAPEAKRLSTMLFSSYSDSAPVMNSFIEWLNDRQEELAGVVAMMRELGVRESHTKIRVATISMK